jgi:hypothetical protein
LGGFGGMKAFTDFFEKYIAHFLEIFYIMRHTDIALLRSLFFFISASGYKYVRSAAALWGCIAAKYL